MIQRTLILLKPDTVKRGLIGIIISRFEQAGLKLVAMKMVWVDKSFSKKHYSEHVGKPFYKSLENFITEGPTVGIVIEGVQAVEIVRKIVGPTEPNKAPPGTIRGDFAHHSYIHTNKHSIAIRNMIHASDSEASAKREIALWFGSDELHSYKLAHEYHVF